MYFAQLLLLGLSSAPLLTLAVPFDPQDGRLQQNRRRLVDYPVRSASKPRADGAELKLGKRAAMSYSVVQVDGSSQPTQSAAAPAVETVVSTVTQAQATVIYTMTTSVPGSPSAEEVVVTNIGVATSAPTQEASPTLTVVRTVTASPSPTSTQMYDDGMWHTYYPVKTWSTHVWSNSSTATATATGSRISGAATPSDGAWNKKTLKRRRVPDDLKLASWNVEEKHGLTRTEKRGARRFGK